VVPHDGCSLVACSHKAREEAYMCDEQLEWCDEIISPPMVVAYMNTSMDAAKYERGVSRVQHYGSDVCLITSVTISHKMIHSCHTLILP
jgi:hypothetical protein